MDRARDKTQGMMARANAIDELTAPGGLTDFLAGDEVDRELGELMSR